VFIPLADVNPTTRRPVVTQAIIVVTILAWLWQTGAGSSAREQALVFHYGLVPLRLFLDPFAGASTLVTSMFLHGGLAHLAGNMLFLHIFGDNVEDALGRGRYAAFYLGCGVVAGLAHALVGPTSTLPMVGASGAVAGVLGAYLVLHPRAPILVFNGFIFPWPLLMFPAWLAIGMWFILNLLGGLASLGMGQGGGVAYFAHIGGFAAGLLAIRACIAGRACKAVDPWDGWRPPPRRPPGDDPFPPRPPGRDPWDGLGR
jgi:membrane associated rhomboid family serine protease